MRPERDSTPRSDDSDTLGSSRGVRVVAWVIWLSWIGVAAWCFQTAAAAFRVDSGLAIGQLEDGTGELTQALWNAFYQLVLLCALTAAGFGVLVVHMLRRTRALRAARRKARRRRLRLESIVETAQDLIWSSDPGGALTFVNGVAETLYGEPREALLGRRLLEFASPASRAADERAFEMLQRADGSMDHETVHCRADGSEVHLRFRARAVINDRGRFVGISGTASDVTKLHQMQQEHIHSQRVQAIGTLAGGIAHDFNNLLMAIVGYCDLARLSLDDPAQCEKDLIELEKAALRGRSLTDQLLSFARRQPMQRQIRDLNRIFRSVERLARRVIPESIELTFECDGETLPASVDRGRIEHVLLNLAVNARDAIGTNGRIHFRLQATAFDGKPHAEFTVTDTGSGMDQATLRQVFDPYFTTKELDKGTGLGLSMAQGIVEQHGGVLLMASTPGKGTTVTLCLPVQPGATLEESWDIPASVPSSLSPSSPTAPPADVRPAQLSAALTADIEHAADSLRDVLN